MDSDCHSLEISIIEFSFVLTFQIYLERNFEIDRDMISMICQFGTQWNCSPGPVLLSFMFFIVAYLPEKIRIKGWGRFCRRFFHNPTQTYAVRIGWYYSNWLDELIRMYPSVSLVSISQCQKSRIKNNKNLEKNPVKVRVQNFWVIVNDLGHQLLGKVLTRQVRWVWKLWETSLKLETILFSESNYIGSNIKILYKNEWFPIFLEFFIICHA